MCPRVNEAGAKKETQKGELKGNKKWETKGRKGKERVEGGHTPPLLFIYRQDLFDFSVTPPPNPDTPPLLFSTAATKWPRFFPL